MDVKKFLETVPLCKGFAGEQMEALAGILSLQLFPAGNELFREGGPGIAFYFVVEGEVGVYKQIPGIGQQKIATLGPREPVGHMCLIDGDNRSATCLAEKNTRTLRGDKILFDRLFNAGDVLAYQFVDAISRDLCNKLRDTNQKLLEIYAGSDESASILRQIAWNVTRCSEAEVGRVDFVPIDPDRPLRRRRSYVSR